MGVEKLIEEIGEGAVSKAAPRIFGKGALVGALGTAATGVAAMAAKRYLDNKKAREALADNAKAQLKAAVGVRLARKVLVRKVTKTSRSDSGDRTYRQHVADASKDAPVGQGAASETTLSCGSGCSHQTAKSSRRQTLIV